MWWKDLLLFFFPFHCLVCGKRLTGPGDVLCLDCEYGLPRTHYSSDPSNPVSRTFWGRVQIEMGTSLFHFEKGSGYQALLHALKYKGQWKAGRILGRILGHDLNRPPFSECECMIPVPLHPKRLRTRGYNQSEMIARGVSDVTGIPVNGHILARIRHHDSQTSLGRYSRYKNVRNDFRLIPGAPDLNGRMILLVDDVITTGATLEACITALRDRFDCRVCVATVCLA